MPRKETQRVAVGGVAVSSGVIREALQASKKEDVDFECAISVVTGVAL